ncbi:DUF488 domain-containing protein [Gimesia chilikensis]|uniref:DUF488 domain-containing protein n=1 Tax=Gimesia chilikensis TaxID=2605989 RepID=UPI003A8E41FA
MTSRIQIKRVYDKAQSGDGLRVLVDRLWPRGVAKEKAAIDVWAKELTPSNELRKWFHSHSDQYHEFTVRYRAELEERLPELQERIAELSQPRLTLVTSVKEPERSHVPVLCAFLTANFTM